MAKDPTRRTASFDAAGRTVELYEMTDGQKMALGAVNTRDSQSVIRRMWAVLESLFVNPDDFQRLDDALVQGRVHIKAVEKFASDVLRHEWPKIEPESVESQAHQDGYGKTLSPHGTQVVHGSQEVPATFRPAPNAHEPY